MPETANDSSRANYRSNYRAKSRAASTPRTLTWIREPHLHAPACSQCAWLFHPSGPPTGSSLEQMKENYMRSCNEEFAAHICARYPKAPNTNVSFNQTSRSQDTEGRSARTKQQSRSSDR